MQIYVGIFFYLKVWSLLFDRHDYFMIFVIHEYQDRILPKKKLCVRSFNIKWITFVLIMIIDELFH